MNVALRHGLHGLGQSGETETEGGGLPGGSIDFSSGEVNPFTYTTPWTPATIGVTSATPEEQAAARNWLAHAFDPLAASKIAQALASGVIVVSKGLTPGGQKICPSGYAYPNGQCIQVSGSQALIPGISNQTLAIIGIAFFALVMIGGGRRR
jgi:hypothetical protein